MYKITWDEETGGVLLNTTMVSGTLGISPRPVFFEELDLIGLDKLGWSYPRCAEPIMWAVNKQYWYRGQHLFDAKGANIYTKPTLEMMSGVTPMALQAVDVEAMLERTKELMSALESEAIYFIRETFDTYSRANKTYAKAEANKLDFDAMAERAGKKTGKKMVTVRQDCDSFDVMPLSEAERQGKRVLLTTKIDRFIASFSGGKDSQVVLDLCTRAIPPSDFEVIYSDTGYELPPSLELYEQVQEHYHKLYPSLKFHTARNHESVLNYWDKIGTPSDTHRWCCSIMKTAPLYRMLKVDGNKQARVLTFDGVRAEESTRRSGYERIGKGKHTFVYNAHPILEWSAVEIFLYLFNHKLQINPAYRVGKARVGCLICPFSSSWDDMIINSQYQTELQPFINKLKSFSEQAHIQDFNQYLSERKWKLKPLGNIDNSLPHIKFKEEISPNEFYVEISNAKQSLKKWLFALGEYSITKAENGFEGQLSISNNVYSFRITEDNNKAEFFIEGLISPNVASLLRRYIYKSAYCEKCEVCEVDCPTGALTIVPSIDIDKTKCTHCHKCFNIHDRGCIAADCARMKENTEKASNSKVQGYKKFGLREEWVAEYFSNPENFWNENSLGTAQVDALKAWLRDAEITDAKNKITELGEVLQDLYSNNPNLFWQIVFINLSYNSFIVRWFCQNIQANQQYNYKLLKEEIACKGYAGNIKTVENAAVAFQELIRKSSVGDKLEQGIQISKDCYQRKELNKVCAEAVAYSIYRFAKEKGITMMRVSDIYRDEAESGIYKEFLLPKTEFLKNLRFLSSGNRVLIAELSMGLEHITLRDDLNHLSVLKELLSSNES